MLKVGARCVIEICVSRWSGRRERLVRLSSWHPNLSKTCVVGAEDNCKQLNDLGVWRGSDWDEVSVS
jgi:hypothetical protein